MVEWEELWDEMDGGIFLKKGPGVFCRATEHFLSLGFPRKAFEYPLPPTSIPLTKGLMSW